MRHAGIRRAAFTIDIGEEHSFQWSGPNAVIATLGALTGETTTNDRIETDVSWTARWLLSQADGVVCVVDSQAGRLEGNEEQLRLLQDHLGKRFEELPIVFQLNKRDLPGVLPLDSLKSVFRSPRCAHVESVAASGHGCAEALDVLLSLVEKARSR